LRVLVPPAPMAPKSTRATITYWVSLESKGESPVLRIDATVVLHETPYCDYFHVHERFSLSPGPRDTEVSKAFCLVFCKSTIAKSMIQSNSLSTQKKSSERLHTFFHNRVPQEVRSRCSGRLGDRPMHATDAELKTVLQPCACPVDILYEADLLYADAWDEGNLIIDLLRAIGASEIEVGPWAEKEGVDARSAAKRHGVREVQCQVPVPPGLKVKTSEATLTFWITCGPASQGQELRIDSTLVLHAMLHEDPFHVHERIVLTASPGGAEVSKSFAIIGSKTSSAHQSHFVVAQKKSAETLVSVFQRRPRQESTGADLSKFPVLAAEDVMIKVMSSDVVMDLARETELLFADDWSDGNLVVDLLKAVGSTEIDVQPWVLREEGGPSETTLRRGIRELHLRVLVPPAPMAPKSTSATMTYWITEESCGDGRTVRIDSTVVLHETPYCEYFHVHERLCLGGDAKSQTISKTFALVFSKSTLAKSVIQANSQSTQKKSGEVVLAFIKAREGCSCPGGVDGAGSQDPQSPGMCTSKIVTGENGKRMLVAEVWELQRRYTLFHQSWDAPFLPHDAEKKWRWVDNQYCRHTLLTARGQCVDRELVSQIDSPNEVLLPPPGWKALGSDIWKVVPAPGSCDEECWQYAVDFYTTDSAWSDAPAWMHCRRRRWRAEFEVDIEGMFDDVAVAALKEISPSKRDSRCCSWKAMVGRMILLVLFLVVIAAVCRWRDAPPASCLMPSGEPHDTRGILEPPEAGLSAGHPL